MPTPTGTSSPHAAAPGRAEPGDRPWSGCGPHAGSGRSTAYDGDERRARAEPLRRGDRVRAGVIAALLLATMIAATASTQRILAARGVQSAAPLATPGGGSRFVPMGTQQGRMRKVRIGRAPIDRVGTSAAGTPIGARGGAVARNANAPGGQRRTLDMAVTRAPSGAPAPPGTSGGIASRPGGSLAAARARLSGGRAAPGREVDRWTVRMAVHDRAGTVAALERMRHYEPLVRSALARHGLPAELVALPVVESAYLAGATSHAGAVGIWQLMPATARALGLEVSEHVDERRDPVRSTEAATRHLADLHGRFGSWHLALAAYNAGGGRVGGALGERGARGDDLLYWLARERLPAETREYVPKLLAAARVARDPVGYGLSVPAAEPLAFRRVRVPAATTLDEVARRTGHPVEEIHRLNPHLVRRRTPPDRPWPVRIPLFPGAAPE